MTEALPKGLEHYATSRFTHKDLPEKLRKDHRIKAGVWGQLVVHSGQLLLNREHKPDLVISAWETAVFAPEEVHSVNPVGEVEFEVQFHRQGVSDAT